MPKNGSAGIALLLTVLSILVFAFMVFMGTEYLLKGDHLRSVICCVVFLLIMGLCIWLSCWGKTTRNKYVGRVIEILSLVVAAVALYIGRTPFSQFVYIIEHENEINTLVQDARSKALGVDSAYINYADGRIEAYRKYLTKNKQHDVALKVRSLKRRLKPDSIGIVSDERHDWLTSWHKLNIWNISTPKNLYNVIEASNEWGEQYAEISRIIYKGEDCQPFAVEDIETSVSKLSQTQTPGKWSNIAMAVCCILILTFYIQCVRSRSRYDRHHK